ncbi:MAG: histidine phosphatase family protein [Ginsengibacter sp.]
MKTLLIVRHAKSSWQEVGLSDFDRPLNDRGKEDAPRMAQKLLDKKIKIDCFISSPAKRAQKTAKLFMKEYDTKKEELILVPSLYEASSKNFYAVIENFDDDCTTAAIFSHNPGITDFVNSLTEYSTDNMPTCAVFAVSIDIKKWKHFKEGRKSLLFFDFPKNPD